MMCKSLGTMFRLGGRKQRRSERPGNEEKETSCFFKSKTTTRRSPEAKVKCTWNRVEGESAERMEGMGLSVSVGSGGGKKEAAEECEPSAR